MLIQALVAVTLVLSGNGGAEASTRSHHAHRLAWVVNGSTGGIHVVSARTDGTDRRVAYTQANADIPALTLSRHGASVAFAPQTDGGPVELVVVPLLGGRPRNVLRGSQPFDFVGGIGWSPDGTRLAFSGVIDEDGLRREYLWTVGVRGRGLTRQKRISVAESTTSPQYSDDRSLAWTRHGILYSDTHHNLRALKHGVSHLLLRSAVNPTISGDGRTLVITRIIKHHTTTWIASADGGHPRKVASGYDTGAKLSADEVVPSYDGQRLLGERRDSRFIAWDADRTPRRSDHVFQFIGFGGMFATWN